MGEVYRARDTRLGRDVAVKIISPELAGNPDALARFEREARAVAALSHPNILTIHDQGSSDGIAYAVMELLEGETLRARLERGALPPRKAVEIAAQIARGLAAAHARQITHRDLKPENLFLTSDGSVRILDFGLARQAVASGMGREHSETVAPPTEPGIVFGTVGYMAPEQVRGEASDHRADVFALGCVLYEMLTGRRAFARASAAETMAATLQEDPPEAEGAGIAPGLLRTLRRCLEKRPDDRFQSTQDLAFALESAREVSSPPAGGALADQQARRRLPNGGVGFLLGTALTAIVGLVVFRQAMPAPPVPVAPSFKRLTFETGTIRDARFTPDGQSIVYGAAWGGAPLRLFMTRTEVPESVRLALPDARLLSIARSGEMAVSLGHAPAGWMGEGTLARSPVLGNAPRPLLERVREAEWSPNGKDLAIVRQQNGQEQIEFPAGTVLYRVPGHITTPRFSPDGSRLAFGDHPVAGDDAGSVSVVDLKGNRTVLSEGWLSVHGVAWSADGREVWFTATGGTHDGDSLYAVTAEKRLRTVFSGPVGLTLHDIATDGRVLLGREAESVRVEALMAGATEVRTVSEGELSSGQWISRDGRYVPLTDQRKPQYAASLLDAGGQVVPLGEGNATAISPDGRWVLAVPAAGAPIFVHPTGPGTPRTLPNPDGLTFDNAAFLPDGGRVVLFGQGPGHAVRGWVQDIDSGPPRPFTPEGVRVPRWACLPVTPDGRRVIAADESGLAFFALEDGAREPVPFLREQEWPLAFGPDGRSVLVAHGNGLPTTVERVDLTTGRRTPLLEVRAREAAGLLWSWVAVTPDARYYVHSYTRLLSDLFVVDGLK
jgi:hypothetical protein